MGSALERLANFPLTSSIGRKEEPTVVDDTVAKVSDLFDITTPQGYFLNSCHNTLNIAIVEKDTDDNTVLTEIGKILTTKGDIHINSCAGGGKTTALKLRIILDLIDGEATRLTEINGQKIVTVARVFVGTFLSRMVTQLKNSVVTTQRKLGYTPTAENIQYGTYHAEFKRALNSINIAINIAPESELRTLLVASINECGIVPRDRHSFTSEDYKTIGDIVNYYRNRLTDKYSHSMCDEYGLTPLFLDKLVSTYENKRRTANIHDFDDLQELLYKYLYIEPNPALQDYIANRYDYMYLDEFQDISQIQYAIIKFYMRGRLACNKSGIYDEEKAKQGLYNGIEKSGKIIIVGDDDQSIYDWRGSDRNIITHEFAKDFEPSYLTLSTNYRCPDSILNPVIPSILKNVNRCPKSIKAYKRGGEFQARVGLTLNSLISDMLENVRQDISRGKTVTILCRTNYDGIIPALMLEADPNILSFSVSSTAMTLNSPLIKDLINVGRLFTDRFSPSFSRTLKMLCDREDVYAIPKLIAKMKTDSELGMGKYLWEYAYEDFEYSCPSLALPSRKMREYLIDNEGIYCKSGEIEALKYLYTLLKKTTYANADNTFCINARAYIDALLFIIDRQDFESVEQYISTLNIMQTNIDTRVATNKGNKFEPVQITTVHDYKGCEANCCYVWHDSLNVFPAMKSAEEDIEEERSVHYIACTRASEKSIVYALKGREGKFFKELATEPVQIDSIGGVVNKSKVGTTVQSTGNANLDDLLNRLASGNN